MGKYQKKKKSVLPAVLAGILIVLALGAALWFFLPRDEQQVPAQTTGNAAENMQPVHTTAAAATQPTATAVPTLSFPMTLEGGNLELQSLFQFTGINPDAANQECTDVASIQLANTSDRHLNQAKITLTLSDGTALNFTVTDLPAGTSAMAFSTENTAIGSSPSCVDAVCQTEFAQNDALSEEQVSASVNGVTVTLTNHTGEDLSNLVVSCRSPFGESYFGGIAYSYTVQTLPAYGSTTVDAWDCILGLAEVVRITQK